MTYILIAALAILMALVLYTLIRGIVAFLQTTKVDLESGETQTSTEMQMLQNKMMFNRIKFQALAIVVVAVLLAISQ